MADLFKPGMRRLIGDRHPLAILQQVTGINTILYYGSIIFTEQVGEKSASAALFANVVIGAMNLVGTIVALFIIDRIGRKKLLLIASGGMCVSLAFLGLLFQTRPSAAIPILLLILCYVASFSIGMGPGVWVVLSEMM
jgi:MFS family permease